MTPSPRLTPTSISWPLSYKKAADDARKLAGAVDAFLAAPSEDSLKAARQAWVAARPAYLKTESFRFYDGPIEEVEGDHQCLADE